MTKEIVLDALRTVQEPDLGKDIVTLDMVKEIEIEGNYISFTVVLTTPACPLKDMIKNACINAIKKVNKEAVVNVKFTANTTTKRRVLMQTIPGDGGEATKIQFNKIANRAVYQGATPPMNIFNPAAWADFIQAWKRGDFKNKN